MPHGQNKNHSPIPEVTWDTGLKEMSERWKGAIVSFGVGVFFVMTIGIIYWQVVDQPRKNWILRGTFSGLIWEMSTHSLVIQTLTENKTFVQINVRNVGNPEADVPFVRNLCWLNKTEFCFTWDSVADVKIFLKANGESDTECYGITWTPLNCLLDLEDCISMVNVSWYGGASVQAQHWPINNVSVPMQPFIISDLHDDPSGYGSVLERYFLGSTGVAVLVDPDVNLHVSLESMKHLCLRSPSNMERRPLKYTVCVGANTKAVHQELWHHPSSHKPVLPNMDILWSPFWKLLVNEDSGVKLERELRTFSNRLKRHHLGEGAISLTEHSTSLLSDTLDHEYLYNKNKAPDGPSRDLTLLRFLNISLTLSTFQRVDSPQFQTSPEDGTGAYWFSLPAAQQGQLTPLLTRWKKNFCLKLNVSNPAAVTWFTERASRLRSLLDVEYLILEGGEKNPFQKRDQHPPKALATDMYIQLLAGMATRIGSSTIVTAGARSSHMPLFIRMVPRSSDWSYSGLKGLIPLVLQYSLLGYSFFIPDAVGGSLAKVPYADEELFIRWLEIVCFLPVMSFHTPPWVYAEDKALNLTRSYIAKHHNFVIPIILKYSEEWKTNRSPIFRPLWWISPDDSNTFTIDDEFLIGNEVLVAPVVEKGATHRDIYLPGSGFHWQDLSNTRVFDGGTFLRDYAVGLEEVAVFLRRNS